MPRLGRKATFAFAACLAVAMVFLAASALAQEGNATATGNETATGGAGTGGAGAGGNGTGGAGGNGTGDAAGGARVFRVKALEAGCPEGAPQCWDMPVFPVLPGDRLEIVVDLEGSQQPHDLTLEMPSGEIRIPERSAIGGVHRQTVEIPADLNPANGRIEFFCSVHETTMFGFLGTPAALTAGQHVEEIPHLGVHFLAYWVGLIAFAVIFIVYGITFFLFKYGETNATTDHWDRTGAEPGRGKRALVNGFVAALAIAILVGAAVVYLTQVSAISELTAQLAQARADLAAANAAGAGGG